MRQYELSQPVPLQDCPLYQLWGDIDRCGDPCRGLCSDRERTALFGSAAAAAATICWGIVLTVVFQKKLSAFTAEICATLEEMAEDSLQEKPYMEEETLLARIVHRLRQLYKAMQKQEGAECQSQGGASVPCIGYFTPDADSGHKLEDDPGDPA